ncbi:MAG: flavin reductase family protein [Actinomycetota bacterium]|nr:flavin reductase family protein [Actinomycetota bacterium]
MDAFPRPRPAALTPRGFRDVLGRFASGVTVLTTILDDVPHGMTVNAFASVSLRPLLVLACVDRSTIMCDLVTRSGVFAVSVLNDEQLGLSTHFADPFRPSGRAQFHSIAHHAQVTGAPVIDGCIAFADCRIWAVHDGGDHIIVVGEPVALGLGEEADPLLFYRGAYRQIRPEGQ